MRSALEPRPCPSPTLAPRWEIGCRASSPMRTHSPAWMREVAAIARGEAPELVWLLEHPPLYTAGTSAQDGDLVAPERFPVHRTGRGGQYTYHGPGQRVAYVMLDLRRRGQDVRAFVAGARELAHRHACRLQCEGRAARGPRRRLGRRPEKGAGVEDKIAAIGIRVRHGVSFHGVSLNVDPDLSHFSGIVPCGVEEHGVTSLVDLGLPVTMEDADMALHDTKAYRESSSELRLTAGLPKFRPALGLIASVAELKILPALIATCGDNVRDPAPAAAPASRRHADYRILARP